MMNATTTASVVDLAKFFMESPAGRAVADQALRAQERERLETRAATAAALVALERDDLADARRAEKAIAPLHTAERAAEAALATARERRATCEQERAHRASAAWRQLEAHRQALERSASPQIPAFKEELAREFKTAYASRDDVAERNIDNIAVLLWTNRDSIERRVVAIQAAREALAALMYEALDEAELAGRLAALRASFPALDPRPARWGGHAV